MFCVCHIQNYTLVTNYTTFQTLSVKGNDEWLHL